MFLTELIVIRLLLWIIRTAKSSSNWYYLLFSVVSPLVLIPLAIGTGDVVKDFLRLPAWVDLPIVTYIPLAIWYISLAYLQYVRITDQFGFRERSQELSDAISVHVDAISSVDAASMDQVRL